MSIRNPKSGKNGKGARTHTARIIRAIATDIRSAVDALDRIASSYDTNEGDHAYDASQVDLALDFIAKISHMPVWPRMKRTALLHSANRRVYGKINLPAPKYVVVLAPNIRCAHEAINQLGRNPNDRRIIYLTDPDDSQKIRGLDRNTPWTNLGIGIGRTLNETRVRFESGTFVRNIADLISLINWQEDPTP